MRWFVVFLVMLTAAPALAFEGEIAAKAIGGASAEVGEMQIYIGKNGDVRMDTSTKDKRGKSQRVSYIKPAKGKYDYMLDHQEKRAMKISKSSLTRMTEGAQDGDESKKANVEVKQLGTATVAGQTTRHVRVIDKDDGDTADLWLSDRYPFDLWMTVFSFGGANGTSPTNEWTRIAESTYGFKPGFIMKMVSANKGEKGSGLEVTRIKKGKVPADKFALPKGYQVATMPDMGGAPSMKMPTTQEEAEKMRDEWLKKMEGQQ